MSRRKRPPTDIVEFPNEVAARLRDARDLLNELERHAGNIDHTMPEKLSQPVDPGEAKRRSAALFRRIGMDLNAADITIDFEKTPGIRLDDTTLFRNHPLLVSGIKSTRALLERKGTVVSIPEIGVVTHPSFNAAVVSYRGNPVAEDHAGLSEISVDCTAIVVHFHIFWILPDLCWALCWLSSVPQSALQNAAAVVAQYFARTREGIREGTGNIPEFPPTGTCEPLIEVSCGFSAWCASILAVTFVMLHEAGHIHLHSEEFARQTTGNTCSFFRMAGDPHEREFEADAFAGEHLRLLANKDLDGVNLSPEQFRQAVLLGITGLFAAIKIFDRQGFLSRFFRPASHPDPYKRCDRSLETLGFSKEERKRTQFILRALSALAP